MTKQKKSTKKNKKEKKPLVNKRALNKAWNWTLKHVSLVVLAGMAYITFYDIVNGRVHEYFVYGLGAIVILTLVGNVLKR